jgi:membrane protease YdiL (CAAX protease family)
MEIIQLLLLEIVIPLGVVVLIHFRFIDYPEPLPLEENRRRGYLETFVLLALAVLFIIAIIFSDLVEKMADPTPIVLLQFILVMAIPYVLIPVLYLKLVRKWTLRDFGFRKPVEGSRSIIIFSIALFALAGALPLVNSAFTPAPFIMIVFALVQPAFFEEFFFRGVIQGNLERFTGQNRAWIYGGLLFGIAHVLPNYYVGGLDFFSGIILFITQVISGWIFGILYMKTRSLWPGIVAHFLTNATLASIIALIFQR